MSVEPTDLALSELTWGPRSELVSERRPGGSFAKLKKLKKIKIAGTVTNPAGLPWLSSS